MKFLVTAWFDGSFEYEIEAKSEDEAIENFMNALDDFDMNDAEMNWNYDCLAVD